MVTEPVTVTFDNFAPSGDPRILVEHLERDRVARAPNADPCGTGTWTAQFAPVAHRADDLIALTG